MLRSAAVAVLAGLLTGCGIPADDAPRVLHSPRSDYGSSSPAPDAFGPGTERLYLVRDGKLVRTLRRVAVARTPQQVVQDLLAGPTWAEQQDSRTSALSTMSVGATTLAQRRARAEIGAEPAQGARSDEVLADGQIVCSLTSQGADVGTVSFIRDGQPLAVPRSDGSLSTGPLTIADYAALIDS